MQRKVGKRSRALAWFISFALIITTVAVSGTAAFASENGGSGAPGASVAQGSGDTGGSVTALAKAKKYTVTFDANGGTVKTKIKAVKYGNPYGSLAKNPKRTGYTFLGWFTKKSGGTQVLSTTVFGQKKNVVLFAHWQANQYQVTFNATPSAAVVKALQKKYPELKKNYYVTPGAIQASGYAHVSSVDFFSNLLQVTFDKKFGKLPDQPNWYYNDSYQQGVGASVNGTILHFTGWYTKPMGKGVKITSGTKVSFTKNAQLYADWEPGVGIAFYPNGYSYDNGVWTGAVIDGKDVFVIKQGAKIGKLPTPTWAGHTFLGWYTDPVGGTKITSSTRPKTPKTGGMNYYFAHWQ
ncbi:MAG: InlB B-repeat-containing protein [Firmicutes bacterium]|nr:InlB B-repeat-containing protein [Bacillota bacterium]